MGDRVEHTGEDDLIMGLADGIGTSPSESESIVIGALEDPCTGAEGFEGVEGGDSGVEGGAVGSM